MALIPNIIIAPGIKNTSAVLIASNLVYKNTQVIQETDTYRTKIGDGLTAYTDLTYVDWSYEIVESTKAGIIVGVDTYVGKFGKSFFITYFPMQRIRVRFATGNVGASALNLNSLGAKAIKKNVSGALVAGDIIAGGIYELCYDGTNWQVISSVGSSAGGGETLAQTLVLGRDVDAIGTINTSASVLSMDINTGTLYDMTGVPFISVFYGASQLWDSSGNTSIDWSTRTLADVTGSDSILWDSRELWASGVATLNWNTFTLHNSAAVTTLNWNTRIVGVGQWDYAADYSGTYTTRSLVDKAYVDAAIIAGGGAYLPLAGGTLTGNLLFSLDNTLDIGASGATRPRRIYVGTEVVSPLFTGALAGNATTSTTTTNIAGGTLGAIPYQSGVGTTALLAATATAGQMLRSGASAAPTWSTNVWANTTPIGQILYATSANVIGGSTTLLTDGTYLVVGDTAQLFSSIGLFRKDQNAATAVYVLNNTSGTAATAWFSLYTTTGGQGIDWQAFSAGYTTSGLAIANSSRFRTGSALTNGMTLATGTTAPISFAVNDTRVGMFLSTGEFILGNVTSLVSGEFFSIQKNQNANTFLRIRNTTSGTAACTQVAMTDATGNNLAYGTFSALFTTSGINEAATGVINSSMTSGLNIGTNSNSQLSFWTNNTKRITYSNAGAVTYTGASVITNNGSYFADRIYNAQAGSNTISDVNACWGGEGYYWWLQSNAAHDFVIGMYNSGSKRDGLLISQVGNVKIGTGGTNIVRGTTEGTNTFSIFNGTAPVGTLANGISLFSAAGVLKCADAAGVVGFVNSSTDGAAAPATNAIGVILDYFGTSATRVLTTPNSWETVIINGVTYKRPLYT